MITSMQLEEAEDLWRVSLSREIHAYPFLTYAWHAAWQALGKPAQKVMVYTDGHVLVPFVRMGTDVHFSGGEEIADYLDAIGEPDKKEAFWKELLPYLKTLGIRTLILRNIPYHSPTKEILVSLGGNALEEDSTPIIRLPASWDAYLAQLERKDRHELQRKLRKFDLVTPDTLFSMEEKESIDMDALLGLMKRDSEKLAFLTPPMEAFGQVLPKLPHVPIVQANLRAVSGVIIASALLFPVDSTLLLYNSGFNAAFHGSGFYLKAKTILWAIDHRITEYNFLQGRERYKYELGAVDQPVFRIEINI
ncbi:GNAT family N-acetyltransferase [Candidatus Gottesmanbacteria bacterium]|nr:GNAT family N-acetyltransferase [Candidatus Gottesmanbacteria bacterium]